MAVKIGIITIDLNVKEVLRIQEALQLLQRQDQSILNHCGEEAAQIINEHLDIIHDLLEKIRLGE